MTSNPDLPQGRALVEQLSTAFEAAAANVSPSVVPILSEQTVEVQSPFGSPDSPFGDDFFKQFFRLPPSGKQRVRGVGSGVIVSPDGYILTNNHVVDGADKLTVVLQDKKRVEAEVIGTDPQTDVAVIKVDARDLPAATLGDSDQVKVGQWVIAVGNPFQLMHTVTTGIVSAKGRSSIGLADYEDFIQTDASINPGNSGGALANLDGKVIGINTAISSPSGGSVGIGFAIPINMARGVMDSLIKNGKVTRGYLGALLQDIDENLAKALNLGSTRGVLVADVTPGSPAERAGLKRGDVIMTFNGEPVTDTVEIRKEVAQGQPGSSARLSVLREGHKIELSAVLAERPRERASGNREEPAGQRLGLSVQPLTPEIARELGYPNQPGVIVAGVEPGSPAEEAGLQPGDWIMEVNRAPVPTVPEFVQAVERVSRGDTLALLVRRGPGTFYLALQIP